MAQQVGKSNADHLASQGSIFFHIRGWLKTSPMFNREGNLGGNKDFLEVYTNTMDPCRCKRCSFEIK